MPWPLSRTEKAAKPSPVFSARRWMAVVVWPWMTAFSIRLERTCSMRMGSIGTMSSSAGTSTENLMSGSRLRAF